MTPSLKCGSTKPLAIRAHGLETHRGIGADEIRQRGPTQQMSRRVNHVPSANGACDLEVKLATDPARLR